MAIQGHVDDISPDAVTGWAIDWDHPASALEISIIVDGVEAGRCHTDIERAGLKQALGGLATGFHEFRFQFDPPLDRFDHHTIEVMSASGRIVLPNGRRTLFPTRDHRSGFTPILVTSSGRSGSTMLMREFATHPNIVISNIYPFEMKLTSYYAAVWNVLTASCHTPGDIETDFGRHASEEYIIGRNPWNRADLLDAAGGANAIRWLHQSFPTKLEFLLRSTIEDYYGILSDKNHMSARMFAEKSTINAPVRQACRVLFSTVKEIVLVRDPRDYICSAKSFWQTGTDKMFTTMEIELPALMAINHLAPGDVLFIRYEDLVLEGPSTRRRIYDFLECDADFNPHSIAADHVPDSHRTSRSAAASIGRFRIDLDEGTIKRCEDNFRSFMTMFGYK